MDPLGFRWLHKFFIACAMLTAHAVEKWAPDTYIGEALGLLANIFWLFS